MSLTFVLIAVSFVTAIIDLIFGMGFGLTMTPILIFSGFEPHQIVPALLISSLAGNIVSPFFHHRFKNVDFNCGAVKIVSTKCGHMLILTKYSYNAWPYTVFKVHLKLFEPA